MSLCPCLRVNNRKVARSPLNHPLGLVTLGPITPLLDTLGLVILGLVILGQASTGPGQYRARPVQGQARLDRPD